MFFEWESVENPTGGNPEAPADWAAEVLDATTKSELDGLSLKIDITDKNKEGQFTAIDALFWKEGKIRQIEDEDKRNNALKYALKDAKIKMWAEDNSIDISIMEIANLFWKYVEQDNGGRRLKVKEITDANDKDFQGVLQELVSSPKQSPLAYLIQITSNFAKIQAENWYGRETEANRLREIKEDKALGNQTRRALAWLKSWVEWWKIEENNIHSMTVDQVLDMKYISADLRDKLIANGTNEVKQLWEKAKGDNPTYEYRVPYTSNYALKKIWEEDSVPQGQDHSQDQLNVPDYEWNIESSLKNSIFEAAKENTADLLGTDYELRLEWENIRVCKKGVTLETAANYLKGELIPIKKCLKQNDENINIDYIKSAVSNAIDKIKMKERAQKWVDLIKAKHYNLTDVFPENLSTYGLNDIEKSRVTNFFWSINNWNYFGNFLWWISFFWTELSWENIGLVLSKKDSVFNFSIAWLLSHSGNPDLKIKANDVVKDDNTLNEDKFKEILRNAIIGIIRNDVYKNSLT